MFTYHFLYFAFLLDLNEGENQPDGKRNTDTIWFLNLISECEPKALQRAKKFTAECCSSEVESVSPNAIVKSSGRCSDPASPQCSPGTSHCGVQHSELGTAVTPPCETQVQRTQHRYSTLGTAGTPKYATQVHHSVHNTGTAQWVERAHHREETTSECR